MLNRTTLRRHADLVDRMANAQGIDLEEQMLRGHLSTSELEDAVLRCTGCSKPCDCDDWLSRQGDNADAAPSYCRNGALFAGLKQG